MTKEKEASLWQLLDVVMIYVVKNALLTNTSFTVYMEQEASAIDLSEKYIVSGTDENLVGIYSVPNGGELIGHLEGHSQAVTAVRLIESDGSNPLVVSSSYDCNIRLWSLTAGLCLAVFKGHRDFVRSLAIRGAQSLERMVIVSADFGGFVRLWRLKTALKEVTRHVERSVKRGTYETLEFIEHRSFCPHRNHITSVDCDLTKFVTGSRDKSISLNSFL